MTKLKSEYLDLLEPYGDILSKMNKKIFDMSETDLASLSEAVNAVDTRNCWCMIYDAAQWLRIQIDDEFRRREHIASMSTQKEPS